MYQSVRKVNDYLFDKRREVNSFLNELFDSGQIDSMTAGQIKNAFLSRNKTDITFTDFAKKLIKELKAANKLGNASVYQQALDFTQKHSGSSIHHEQ
jgi:hypothetical protein